MKHILKTEVILQSEQEMFVMFIYGLWYFDEHPKMAMRVYSG